MYTYEGNVTAFILNLYVYYLCPQIPQTNNIISVPTHWMKLCEILEHHILCCRPKYFEILRAPQPTNVQIEMELNMSYSNCECICARYVNSFVILLSPITVMNVRTCQSMSSFIHIDYLIVLVPHIDIIESLYTAHQVYTMADGSNHVTHYKYIVSVRRCFVHVVVQVCQLINIYRFVLLAFE